MADSNQGSDQPAAAKHPPRSILKNPDHTNARETREVAFDSVLIRHYTMELGNHPSCTIGAPVSLSWDFRQLSLQDIDAYEVERRGVRRGSQRHLVLNYYRRKEILKKAGYSDSELRAAERQVAHVQRQRKASCFWGKWLQ